MTRLLLVRHGQSKWNALGRWQGQADPPLTELGRRQAQLAADAIGSVDVIVASTLERAHDTALLISAQLGVGPVLLEPDLMERDAGEWSGLTREEIDRLDPGAVDAWRTPPGFEGDDELWDRVEGALTRIATSHAGADVLVATHGGVIYTIEARLGAGQRGRIPNLGALVVTFDGELRLGDRLALLDEDAVAITVPDQI